jgi:hypothetical protein
VLEQGEVLEHEAHLSRLNGTLGRLFTGDPDAPAVRLLQPGDQAQQGALAGSGGAQQGHQRAALDIETHLLDSFEVTEALADVGDADAHGGCWCRSGRAVSGAGRPSGELRFRSVKTSRLLSRTGLP